MKRRGVGGSQPIAVAFAALAVCLVSTCPVGADTGVRTFDISAQEAGTAIQELARQAGRQIVAPGDRLRGLKTPALHGTMHLKAAIDLLLKGTGLGVASDDGSVVVLVQLPPAAQSGLNSVTAGAAQEEITVTGYRASLMTSANFKRNAIQSEEAVFAEDIGKFPDTNIAEAFNRIPGVSISREVDGSGVNVSVRGLGPNFTKVLLNGAQVAVASTGPTNASNANREVDLNMFPVELFTQLTVLKSARASQLEGGTAGTVNMRSVRPFDSPGLHLSYSLKAVAYDSQATPGSNGALIVSDTIGPFGALIGITNLENRFFTRGYETAGWTTPHLLTDGPVVQCAPAASCNTMGGGNWSIPTVVPTNVTMGGLVPGAAIDSNYLQTLNPGLSLSQINNMLLPRLGRYFMEKGVRSRYNGIAAFEYRPSDQLQFYLDMVGARLTNHFDRSDINWIVRNGSAIPLGVTVDVNNVVQHGLFANAQWLLEARPYRERGDFYSINPGGDWRPTALWHISWQANVSRSHFLRDSPTILLATAPSAGNDVGVPGVSTPMGGVYVEYQNATVPTLKTNIDLNDPASFQWAGGRVNVTAEKRYTYTNGFHLDVVRGGDDFNLASGFAYDEAYRNIQGYDNSMAWQAAVCGNGPSIILPAPNSQPPCQGLAIAGSPAAVAAAVPGYPLYSGLGTGYTAGNSDFAYLGSLIPQSALASYLRKGPAGFVAVDYDRFMRDAHYSAFAYPNAPEAVGTNLGIGSGVIDEKTIGFYVEWNGAAEFLSHSLKYNLGLRGTRTYQTVVGPVSHYDTRNGASDNALIEDGSYYPNYDTHSVLKRAYNSWLPAANFVYEISDAAQLRLSFARTMTRPNPNSMLPGTIFSDPSANAAVLGNSDLRPYYSNNVDLGFDVFTGDEGHFGMALFHKDVSGFTVTNTVTKPFSALETYGIRYATLTSTQQAAITARGGPTNAMVQVVQPINLNDTLAIGGIEFSAVQPLDLLGLTELAGFGIKSNLTIINEQAPAVAGRIATGVTPFSYNLTAYYERDGISFRTSYVFNASFALTDSNQNGVCLPNTGSSLCPDGARLYARSYAQLDLSSSIRLSRIFGDIISDPELIFDVQNLTRSKIGQYFQYKNATYAIYAPGSIYMLGLRGRF